MKRKCIALIVMLLFIAVSIIPSTSIVVENELPTELIIDGPIHGRVGETLTYFLYLIDPEGCNIWFYIDWDDGAVEEWIGPFAPHEEVYLTHAWDKSGNYTIFAGAKHCNDTYHATLNVTIIDNHPPGKPWIKGPIEVWIGVEYTFYITFDDPDGDDIFFYIDWGDGTHSGWMGPYPSGVTVSFTHYWTEAGTYVIRIKAKDVFGEESGWSEFIIRVIPPPRFFRHMKISGMLKTKPWRGLILSVINFDCATVTEGISGNVQLEPFTCHNYKFVALALNVHDKGWLYINASAPFMILIGY